MVVTIEQCNTHASTFLFKKPLLLSRCNCYLGLIVTNKGAFMQGHIINGIKLLDISEEITNLLPASPKLRPSNVDPSLLVVHHSGAEGAAGAKGAYNSTKYVTNIRGWSMPAYHFWIPAKPSVAGTFELVQLAPIEWLCYHTKGINDVGVGLCVQGNRTKNRLTDHQEHVLSHAIPHIHAMLSDDTTRAPMRPLGWLTRHSEADSFGGHAKPSCPGKWLDSWLDDYIESAAFVMRTGLGWEWE